MTQEAHIYKMAYAQAEGALSALIDACYDNTGRPRIPPPDALNAALECLPADRRPKVRGPEVADVSA